MALVPGTRLGPYEIVAALGAGGMGEVYRARDTKLDRLVALKVVPDLFAGDAERLQRFEREAKTLAALNHPNIAQIYGIEIASGDAGSGPRALIMELVEGESLAARLARERVPMDEVLAIARQIIDALEAAHEKNIIHRDLKPANIMVTPDGVVKVLDFGLAKIIEGEASATATNSPTLTFAATQAGVILGTAAYMSPEQAKGRGADKRSDVWALGCVIFELLAGKRAFEGDDVTETLAAVLRGEPDWSALPSTVPQGVTNVLRRCLLKDRKARIPDVSAVRFLLDDALTTREAVPPTARRRSSFATVAAMAAAVGALVAGAVAVYFYRQASTPRPISRFLIHAPEGANFLTGLRPGTSVAISPDGRRIAFTARKGSGPAEIWVQALDSFTATPLAGTADAMFPFWSPDSRSIAFFVNGRLQRIEAAGGPPQTVCSVANGRGGTWGPDNTIVFGQQTGGLMRVAATGGQPAPMTRIESGEADHRFPTFLPDGRHVFFYLNGSPEVSGLSLASVPDGRIQRVLRDQTSGLYARGHLLFTRAGSLMAQPFDVTALTTTGDPVPIAEQAESGTFQGLLAFSVSETGTLAYGIGGSRSGITFEFAVLDRSGKTLDSFGSDNYIGVDLSPDGKQIATHSHELGTGARGDVWVWDLARHTRVRLTAGSGESGYPIWSPDGKWIAYSSLDADGTYRVIRRPSDGSGEGVTLFERTMPGSVALFSWSPDGRAIVFGLTRAGANIDVLTLLVGERREPQPLLTTGFSETQAMISPDGKWLAYQSDETGVPATYVRPFPDGTGKWSVSREVSTRPRWRNDGKELFFLGPGGAEMRSVDVRLVEGAPTFANQRVLFSVPPANPTHFGHLGYAVSRDGQRFVFARSPTAVRAANSPIAVVQNWASALGR